jgi:hypothetical protein
MNWDALGAIGEIVGAAAVVLTLAYLSVQIRQNTRSVKSNAFSAWSASGGDFTSQIAGNERLDRILREAWLDEKTLTEETWVTFVIWHQRFFYHLEAVWQMYQLGTLTKHIFDYEIDRTRQLLATPSVKQWWDAGGSRQISKPLREEIEKRVAEPSDFVWLAWDKENGFQPRRDQGTQNDA